MYSSLYYGLLHDNRMELNAPHGSVVCHANDVDIDVPMNKAVNAILRPWGDRTVQSVEPSRLQGDVLVVRGLSSEFRVNWVGSRCNSRGHKVEFRLFSYSWLES